jgi:hypothetical protein
MSTKNHHHHQNVNLDFIDVNHHHTLSREQQEEDVAQWSELNSARRINFDKCYEAAHGDIKTCMPL